MYDKTSFPVNEEEFQCRVLDIRTCPELFGMHCDAFPYPCARFESEAEWPWTLKETSDDYYL